MKSGKIEIKLNIRRIKLIIQILSVIEESQAYKKEVGKVKKLIIFFDKIIENNKELSEMDEISFLISNNSALFVIKVIDGILFLLNIQKYLKKDYDELNNEIGYIDSELYDQYNKLIKTKKED